MDARAPSKTPQDKAVAAMAADYAAFLRQTPWYEYPFRARGRNAVGRAGRRLRFADGSGVSASALEFMAKAAYAKVLAGAVAATGAGAR